MTADRENEYLSDGITEELTMALAQAKGLRVAGRTSAFVFKGKAEDVREIASRLGVETLVEGSVRKIGRQLRITAKLVNAADGCCLWSQSYNRKMQEVFALQDEIATSIAGALKLQSICEPSARLGKRHTGNEQAYELYLQGRYYWNMRGDHLKKAMHYFELALLEDPSYALAYTGIADSWNLLGFYGYATPADSFPKAKAAAVKAVELDDNLAEAHNSLGFSNLMFHWDTLLSTKELDRAAQINPSYSPAHYWMASYLSARGRHHEAISKGQLALRLDPLSPIVMAHMGWTYLHARQFTKAKKHFRAALDLDPDFIISNWGLGKVHTCHGEYDLALTCFRNLLGTSPINSWGVAWMGYVHGLMGKTEEATAGLEHLTELSRTCYVRPYWFALLNLVLNRQNEVFQCLERCIEERDAWLGWIRCDPAFDSLHENPHFISLRTRMGLD
jgi:TolB-like protein